MAPNSRRRRAESALQMGPPGPPSPRLPGASCPRAYRKMPCYWAGLSKALYGPATHAPAVALHNAPAKAAKMRRPIEWQSKLAFRMVVGVSSRKMKTIRKLGKRISRVSKVLEHRDELAAAIQLSSMLGFVDAQCVLRPQDSSFGHRLLCLTHCTRSQTHLGLLSESILVTNKKRWTSSHFCIWRNLPSNADCTTDNEFA